MRRLVVLGAASLLLVAACGDDDTDGTGSAVSATEPPATEPPATEPPATEPPATEPPATEPPATEPPATEPPATEPPATEPPATEPTDPAVQLYGTWQTAGLNRVTFEEDSSWFGVDPAEDAEPFDTGTYTFDGSILIVDTDEGDERCQGGQSGTYEVEFRASLVDLTPVEDECAGRGNDWGYGMVRIEE